jgi:hypothetical protein
MTRICTNIFPIPYLCTIPDSSGRSKFFLFKWLVSSDNEGSAEEEHSPMNISFGSSLGIASATTISSSYIYIERERERDKDC